MGRCDKTYNWCCMCICMPVLMHTSRKSSSLHVSVCFSWAPHLIMTYHKLQISNYECELPAPWHHAPQHLNHLISISHDKKEHSLTALDSSLLVTRALQGEKKCISPSHLRLSHDQSTLQIDMSLSNTGLLLQRRGERRTDGCQKRRAEN